ncbi:MAG TPA: hypothetical protein VMW10_04450 [Alphaproteobacteria bacterium]|nr:hypothetical protein [Alphaproteobacteria bacterium]
MKTFAMTLTLGFAAFLTVTEKPDLVTCNENDGWTCTVWDENQNCRGCTKITTVLLEKNEPVQETPAG